MENESDDIYKFGSATLLAPSAPTGIRDLDVNLGGGFFEDKAHLFIGAAGAGKTTLACQLAETWATSRGPGLLLSEDVTATDHLFGSGGSVEQSKSNVSVVVGGPLDAIEFIRAWCATNPCTWIIVDATPNTSTAAFGACFQDFCLKQKVCGVLTVAATEKAVNNPKVGSSTIAGDKLVSRGMSCCIGITLLLEADGKPCEEQYLYMYASRYSEDKQFPVVRTYKGFVSPR